MGQDQQSGLTVTQLMGSDGEVEGRILALTGSDTALRAIGVVLGSPPPGEQRSASACLSVSFKRF